MIDWIHTGHNHLSPTRCIDPAMVPNVYRTSHGAKSVIVWCYDFCYGEELTVHIGHV